MHYCQWNMFFFIWEWLSVGNSFWGLFKYFTNPSWNFGIYEVKFKECFIFLDSEWTGSIVSLLVWPPDVSTVTGWFRCGLRVCLTGLEQPLEWSVFLVCWGKTPGYSLRREPHPTWLLPPCSLSVLWQFSLWEKPLYFIWVYQFYFSSI